MLLVLCVCSSAQPHQYDQQERTPGGVPRTRRMDRHVSPVFEAQKGIPSHASAEAAFRTAGQAGKKALPVDAYRLLSLPHQLALAMTAIFTVPLWCLDEGAESTPAIPGWIDPAEFFLLGAGTLHRGSLCRNAARRVVSAPSRTPARCHSPWHGCGRRARTSRTGWPAPGGSPPAAGWRA